MCQITKSWYQLHQRVLFLQNKTLGVQQSPKQEFPTIRTTSACVCVNSLSYHISVPQVEGVPGEALWEAVGLLSNVVFVRFNGAV